MMTRRDYVAVSEILKEYRQAMFPEDYEDLVKDFAIYMSKDNHRFMRDKFIEACYAPLPVLP